jgi:predicted RNA binding protein YcfA (HicA-like mRNA interferase family)
LREVALFWISRVKKAPVGAGRGWVLVRGRGAWARLKRAHRGSVKVAICAQARAEKKIVKKIFGARSAFDRSKAVFY